MLILVLLWTAAWFGCCPLLIEIKLHLGFHPAVRLSWRPRVFGGYARAVPLTRRQQRRPSPDTRGPSHPFRDCLKKRLLRHLSWQRSGIAWRQGGLDILYRAQLSGGRLAFECAQTAWEQIRLRAPADARRRRRLQKKCAKKEDYIYRKGNN